MRNTTKLVVAALLLTVSLSVTALAGNLPTIPEPTPDPQQGTTSTTNASAPEPAPDATDDQTDEDGQQSLVEWLLGLLTQK